MSRNPQELGKRRREINNKERDLQALPARMGGLGIYNPTEVCKTSNANSAFITKPLVKLIQRQEFEFDPRELASQMKALRAQVDAKSDNLAQAKLKEILDDNCPESLKIAICAASI